MPLQINSYFKYDKTLLSPLVIHNNKQNKIDALHVTLVQRMILTTNWINVLNNITKLYKYLKKFEVY